MHFCSPAAHSPAPPSDRREFFKRPQHLFLDHDTPRSSLHFSSPSSASPQSTLPWESPRLRVQHSYMNPTASSMAKSSRSSSLGDDMQEGSPPCSPYFPKSRRSCGELEAELPLLASSPVSSALSLLSSQTSSHPTVSPSRFTHNIPPSRIPLPKQPLSPRRSLCLEATQNSSWSGGTTKVSAPTTDPGCDATPASGSQGQTTSQGLTMTLECESSVWHFDCFLLSSAVVRRLSLNMDPSLRSSLPVRQKRDSVSERYTFSSFSPD